MTAEREHQTETETLEIALDRGGLPVSAMSSLLRAVQAALRELARNDDETRRMFTREPQPILRMSADVSGDELILSFGFADPTDWAPLERLSARTSKIFGTQIGEYLKSLPQRGLWGQSVSGPRRRGQASEITKRLDQVCVELRRFRQARLRCDRLTILFEGDRMQIE